VKLHGTLHFYFDTSLLFQCKMGQGPFFIMHLTAFSCLMEKRVQEENLTISEGMV